MNYQPFVSWGFYGTTGAQQRANFYSSWGIMEQLPSPTGLVSRMWSILSGLAQSILGG